MDRSIQRSACKTIGKGRISEVDEYLFGQGKCYMIYEKLGAHPMTIAGDHGTYFAVWAPAAVYAAVVGPFNDWNPEASPLRKVGEERCNPDGSGVVGIWDGFFPGVLEGAEYKFYLRTRDGRELYKADPYASANVYPPTGVGIVCDLDKYQWNDGGWMSARRSRNPRRAPMSIYEVHPGSFVRPAAEDSKTYYNYRELADELIPYVKRMGFTHIELMGIAEYPFDGSWGYQVTGYYAPTARYGSPTDFMAFVDAAHEAGIGVILDWVCAHFPRDEQGLAEFDGSACYEYENPMKGAHPHWGTKIFDFGKNEVRNFLISNALYWVNAFHVDGIRADAVSTMIYLDYGRNYGEWIPNQDGGNINYEALELFRLLSAAMKRYAPGAMLIAEESSAFAGVSADAEDGGLGFDFKWNMGWMHDFLDYMETDSYFRRYEDNHRKMTFSLSYADAENYVLPISHDEVVHLKKPMFYKVFADSDETRFKALRTAYTYMIGHPGKKLMFMGQEFGMRTEWNENVALSWDLLKDPAHSALQEYMRELLMLYREYPALWSYEDNREYSTWDHFEWLQCDDAEQSVFGFVRKCPDGEHGRNLMFVLNFTPVDRVDYEMPVPDAGSYRLVFDQNGQNESDRIRKVLDAETSLKLTIPGYGVQVYEYD